jgi:predicted HD phosphohydrolase
VQAKRYLARSEAAYAARLSPASVHSLALQGGPMNEAELSAFEALPHADSAVLLRRWDDLAKEPGRGTPPLGHYLALLEDLLQQPWAATRAGIATLSG